MVYVKLVNKDSEASKTNVLYYSKQDKHSLIKK